MFVALERALESLTDAQRAAEISQVRLSMLIVVAGHTIYSLMVVRAIFPAADRRHLRDPPDELEEASSHLDDRPQIHRHRPEGQFPYRGRRDHHVGRDVRGHCERPRQFAEGVPDGQAEHKGKHRAREQTGS